MRKSFEEHVAPMMAASKDGNVILVLVAEVAKPDPVLHGRTRGQMYRVHSFNDYVCLFHNTASEYHSERKMGGEDLTMRLAPAILGDDAFQMFPANFYWQPAVASKFDPKDPDYNLAQEMRKHYLKEDGDDWTDAEYEMSSTLKADNGRGLQLIDFVDLYGHCFLERGTTRICLGWSGNHDVALRPGGLKAFLEHKDSFEVVLPRKEVWNDW